MAPQLRVGLSGFTYKPWHGEGRFYPPELKASQFLNYYSERYHAVEMDGSWYRMPASASINSYKKAPEGFEFCFKMHRKVTHMARLKPDGQESLEFFLKCLAPLAAVGKCGPILIQLPPNLKFDRPRLELFLENLPKQFSEEVKVQPRWALEARNPGWDCSEVEDILRSHRVAWVTSETDEREASWRDTADFVYVRLRKTDYTPEELADHAKRIASIGKPAYVFCKHEDDGSPWIWADRIKTVWGQN